MLQFESKHYIFNYNEGSFAEQNIAEIAAYQEACFAYICNTLNVSPEFRIEYFLYDTPEEVGACYWDEEPEPCNGFARVPNQIYAVYNEKVQCIGFHEDAHLISYCINRPPNSAVGEGLAMFFDRKWWRIANQEWTLYYLDSGEYTPIHRIMENDDFFSYDCTVTYPIMGAFTEYLILSYGSQKYMEFYQYTDSADEAFQRVYGKPLSVLNDEFVRYMRLFRLDETVKNRIEELLRE